MSYEKHTWETGETITAEKLNNLEDGVASGGEGSNNFFVKFTITYDQSGNPIVTSDKTLKEIVDAHKDGKNVCGYSEFLYGTEDNYDFTRGIYHLSQIHTNGDLTGDTVFNVEFVNLGPSLKYAKLLRSVGTAGNITAWTQLSWDEE